MSGVVGAIVAGVFVLASAALVAVALGVVRQIKSLSASIQALQARLEPTLAELDREAGITERELARLGEVAARLRKS
ncbi:MAG: hypothetical protein M3N32_05285 [Actinomycetota bacterium]|nr:hypothetical protein [Actinomycetota bacterium]